MPVFIRPIVPTSNKKQYVVAPDGSVLDVGLMPVSKDAKNLLTVDDEGLCVKASDIVSRSPDNMLSVGADGRLFISGTISPEVSTDDYNYARIGRDGGLFISGNDILSNGDINLLTIDPTDHKIILTRAGLLKAMPLVSTDKGNVISSGSDGGAYLTIDDLITDDDPLLFVNGDKQIATSIKLKYNPGNGALDLIGQNGDVITSVTVPTSTSSLKGVYLLNGKPDAMGATTAGDYHFSLQYSMDNGISWGAPIPVIVTATKGMESAGTLPGVEGVNKVRAFFHDLQAESIVSANKATLVFSDETKLTVTPGIGETTFTFTPAVGIETGVFLCFVFLLSDGTVQDVYVDLSTLVDVYAPGDGISITAGDVPIISAKVKDDGGVLVDSSGLHLDLNWINSHITAPTPDVNQGNGITVTDETGAVTVSAKPKENGGVTVDADGISIAIKPSGGILVDGTGLYVDEEWLEEHAPAPKEGNGISISGSTVSVKPNENGGIIADNLGVAVNVTEGGGLVADGTGVHIDESWLADNTFKPVEGNGITISGSTISVKPKENGGIAVGTDGVSVSLSPDGGLETDATGLHVDMDWLSTNAPAPEAGYGISIVGSIISAKEKDGGGITVDSTGISVDAKSNGGIIIDGTGVYVDTNWLSKNVPTVEYDSGNGINISDFTISAVAKNNGGIVVDNDGISVDGSWLSANVPAPEAGNGISVSGRVVSAKAKTSGGIIVDESGISVDASWLSSQIPDPVLLSDSVSSISSTTAASSKAVKTAYDAAQTAQTTANSAMSAASYNTRVVIAASNPAWPSPVTGWAQITLIGGGGGGCGGGGTIDTAFSGGGGGFGERKVVYVYLTEGSTYACTIGAGGAGGASNNNGNDTPIASMLGKSGGTTSFVGDNISFSAVGGGGAGLQIPGGMCTPGIGGGDGVTKGLSGIQGTLNTGGVGTAVNQYHGSTIAQGNYYGSGGDGGDGANSTAPIGANARPGIQGAIIIDYHDPNKENA